MNTYKEAEILLQKDGVGILPTDTLYGIVARAFSKKAVSRIYRLRKRNTKKPLIILIQSIADIGLFGITLSTHDKKILRTLWPEKMSVIIPCNVKKFLYLHRGTNTLAFRIPASITIRRFLKKTGPLVAPSANWEGQKPAKTIKQAQKYFGDTVDFYIDNGKLISQSSTVVALTNGTFSIVRKGAFKLHKRMIE